MRDRNGFHMAGIDAVLEGNNRTKIRESFSYYSGLSAAGIPGIGDRRRFVIVNRVKNAEDQMENQILESSKSFRSSDTDRIVGIINSTVESMEPAQLTYQDWVESESLGDNSDPNADPDQDGRINLFEFFSGSDPMVGDGSLLEISRTSGSMMEVRYVRALDIAGVTATVESTSDLQNWTAMSPIDTTETPGESIKEVAATFSSDESAMYLRLKVELTDG